MFLQRRSERSNKIFFIILLSILFLASGSWNCFGLTSKPIDISKLEQKTVRSETVDTICKQITEANFDQAGMLIEKAGTKKDGSIKQLSQIVSDYQNINQSRQKSKQAAYKDEMTKLKDFEANADANGLKDINDANVLAVVAKMNEYADAKQKTVLMQDPFVTATLERVKGKATESEAKGKWLDSYIDCYSWLQAIDPNNEDYENHSKDLIEKSNIIASFKDSPCETSEERYTGIEKRMFYRGLDALADSYVKTMDYHQMAVDGVKRCKLLGDVLDSSFSQIAESSQMSAIEKKNQTAFKKPTKEQLEAWNGGLKGISSQIEQPTTAMTELGFIEIFEKILKLNESSLKMPEQILIAQFSEASLEALDPYTVMIWPKQVEDFEKALTDEFTGVGIEISKQTGELTAASLLPDTPAYRSGLDAGDIIEEVDGQSTKDMSLSCAVKRITGPKGTKVTLTVRTPGEKKSRKMTIVRDKIVVPTIRGWQRTDKGEWKFFVDEKNKIGYVRVTGFSEKTSEDLQKTLLNLESQGMKGLIIDLRFNLGGLLTSAIEISDMFLDHGLIVSTRPRIGPWTYAEATKKGTHPDYPIVVLINSSSASASEIVSGALQDEKYKRAILVGERTHGKGSVQTITGYPGGRAQLKFTMAYYHLPSGQRVKSKEETKKAGTNDWGIGPDVEVKLRSDELKKMMDVQKDNDVLVKAGHNNGTAPMARHNLKDTLEADPQLAVGRLIVETELVEQSNKIVSEN